MYADLGFHCYLKFRVSAILDTGASPNLVCRPELADELDKHIMHGLFPDICNANNKPIPMFGTFKLSVKLGSFFADVKFILCQSPAAPVILGANFCDCLVEEILPRKKLIELDGDSKVQIVRQPMKRSPTLPPFPRQQEPNRIEKQLTTAVKATETTVVRLLSRSLVKVHLKRRGPAVLHPKAKLYE